jgi:hypothetical protein
MSENKTKPTDASVADFLSAIPTARREDAQAIVDMMSSVTREQPRMWGFSIIGFGTRHYRYASSREGDICRVGLTPCKATTVLYLACDLDRYDDYLRRLGKLDRGVGCLYIKKLDDAEKEVIAELITAAWENRA